MRLNPIQHSPSRLWLLSLLSFLAGWSGLSTAWGATGAVQAFPATGKRSVSGLQMAVDTSWVAGNGYLPVRLMFVAPVPPIEDKTIKFTFLGGSPSHQDDPQIEVTESITFPAGQSTLKHTLLVPQYSHWTFSWWEVEVDGREEENLSLDRVNAIGFEGWRGQTGPRTLIVSDVAVQPPPAPTTNQGNPVPQAIQMFQQFSGRGRGGPINIGGGIDFFRQHSTLSIDFAIPDLPTNWLAYTSLDLIVLTAEQFAEVREQNKAAWQAVEQWVDSGGTLWVYGIENERETYASVRESLTWSNGAALDSPRIESWREVEKSEISTRRLEQEFHRPPREVAWQERLEKEQSDEPKKPPTLAWREHGMGFVIMAVSKNGEIDSQHLQWFSRFDGAHFAWQSRHGVSPSQPNPEFAKLLVPGVGMAPVTEFRILITLFVLVMGPLNYWLLRRAHRLHLLVLTVPLGALLVTCGLFAYAVLGDGFSTRVRSVSFTRLDQQQQRETNWAHNSYYAGLAPPGMSFTDSTAVYPVLPMWTNDPRQMLAPATVGPRSLEWSADSQRLQDGWLSARTPTQYLTVSQQQSQRGLNVTQRGKQLELVNELNTEVSLLVLRDEDGAIYAARDFENAASKTLSAGDEKTIAVELRTLMLEEELEFPADFTPPMASASSFGRGGFGEDWPNLSSGRLENAMRTYRLPYSGPNNWSIPLAPRSYLAVVNDPPPNAVGLEKYRAIDHFHLLYGEY